MRTIARRFDVGDQRARTLLAGCGLAIEKQARPVGQLSGGQKARLGMLVLRLTQPAAPRLPHEYRPCFQLFRPLDQR